MRLIPFLLFLLSGLAYTSWRIWLVLPFGTGWKWGGKFRIATRSEYVILTVKRANP